MLARLMERLNDRRDAVRDGEEAADAGFTLIEVMVVLLILASLLVIAIPTFLRVTRSARITSDRTTDSPESTMVASCRVTTATSFSFTRSDKPGILISFFMEMLGFGVTEMGM